MSTIPTIPIWDTRRGKWSGTIPHYGDVQILHDMFIRKISGQCYYMQPCSGSSWTVRQHKLNQTNQIKRQGVVVISTDRWTDFSGMRLTGQDFWTDYLAAQAALTDKHRTGYIGLFEVTNVKFDGMQTMDFVRLQAFVVRG